MQNTVVAVEAVQSKLAPETGPLITRPAGIGSVTVVGPASKAPPTNASEGVSVNTPVAPGAKCDGLTALAMTGAAGSEGEGAGAV